MEIQHIVDKEKKTNLYALKALNILYCIMKRQQRVHRERINLRIIYILIVISLFAFTFAMLLIFKYFKLRRTRDKQWEKRTRKKSTEKLSKETDGSGRLDNRYQLLACLQWKLEFTKMRWMNYTHFAPQWKNRL